MDRHRCLGFTCASIFVHDCYVRYFSLHRNDCNDQLYHLRTFRFGERDPQYYEFTWGKSVVVTLSGLTQRGLETGTPETIAARITFAL